MPERAAALVAFLLLGSPQADPGVAALAALAPLHGSWSPPPDAEGGPGADFVVHAYEPTVGGMALRLREGYPAGAPERAELDGLIWWDPATGRIEFAAVGGRGAGQGRLFRGEYRALADGAIERVYEVVYRTAADTPGEELGGTTRRYRERYTVEGDVLRATLEWRRDGAWRPFGPGTYTLRRRESSS